jgi:protein involved in polysaccharide export with SLBB domain
MRIARPRKLQFGGHAMPECLKPRKLAYGAGFVLFLAGCATHQPAVDRALLDAQTKPAHVQEVAQHYRISCPDQLVLTVADRPQLSGPRRVNPDGRIDLPSFGRLRVEGHSIAEVRRKVAQVASVPENAVQIQVAEYRSQQVYVFGQVNGLQRTVAYRGEETVLDLLQRIGGITSGAEPKEVYVVRSHVAEGKRPEVFPVDLPAIVLKHDDRTNLRLEPGDQVFIGETRKSRLKKCVPPFLLPLYESLCGLSRPSHV